LIRRLLLDRRRGTLQADLDLESKNMMKLYGAIASPYVARVLMYAKIKDVELPLSEAPGGNIKSPEFLALNPIGKMPTLEVDGTGIGESTIICDYLEDVYPQKSGLPADPIDRARTRLIARIVDLYIVQHISPLFRNIKPTNRDAAVIESVGKELIKAYGYAEHAMGSGPFCVGTTPTLGDCALSTTTMMVKKILTVGDFGIADPTGSGRLATWWKAMEGHALCNAVLQDYGNAFEGFIRMMAARK
jgi:glutathione S-transferase